MERTYNILPACAERSQCPAKNPLPVSALWPRSDARETTICEEGKYKNG